MTALLCIRHAESVMNAEGRWQGQADPPLSPRGMGQARALAAALGRLSFRAILSSDLERARMTAQLLAESLGLPLELHEGLREMDVGRWSGLSHDEIVERWPGDYARFRAGDPSVRPGGGETRFEVAVRVRAVLADAIDRFPRGRVAVVSHGAALRTLAPERRLTNTGRVWLTAASLGLSSRTGGVGEGLGARGDRPGVPVHDDGRHRV